MRSITALVAMATTGLGLAGCDPRPPRPEEGKFRLEVDRVLETDDLLVVRLNLTFTGEQRVQFSEKGGRDAALISPQPGADLGTCEAIVVADRVKSGDRQLLKWFIRFEGPGVTAGAPFVITTEPDQTLDDLVQLTVADGEYDFGTDLEIATLRGDPVHLKVGR